MDDLNIKITGTDPRTVGRALTALADEFDDELVTSNEWNGYALKFPEPPAPAEPEPPKVYAADVAYDLGGVLEGIDNGEDPLERITKLKEDYVRLANPAAQEPF